MNELMTKDNEWIIHFMGSLDRLLDNYERLTANYRPTLGGERFFTDKEVSARLKVSRRTLQDYRNEGRISYIQLGGKILYRESDIEKMLLDGTAPPTDRRSSDFLEGAQFAVCPIICDSNGLTAKRKKERLTDEVSKFCFTCKPFLFLSSDFPSVACFRCRMPFKRVAGRARFSG